jgi:hypothetical protein
MLFSCKKAERTEIKKFVPEFSITINETDEGHLFIVQTNLPDTTELLASIEDENKEILASDKDSVNNGILSFGPFLKYRKYGGGKFSEKYIFVIVMPLVLVQNDNVKKILGEKGENIESPFIFEAFDSVGLELKFNVDFETGVFREKE